MSISRPYKSVKKTKSGNSDKNQSLISSFFGTAASGSTKSNIKRTPLVLTTPEKVALNRSNSFLSKAVVSSGTFDEFASSDTSFDSPEINNFKNPALARSFMGQESHRSQVVDLTQEDETDVQVIYQLLNSPTSHIKTQKNETQKTGNPPLKRGHQDLLERLNGQPRKVPRNFKLTSPLFTSLQHTSLIPLSEEQLKVIKYIVLDGLNVFYTGSAGTGKSIVLRELVLSLHLKYGASRVGVTASTGLAACNIGGQTIHRFLSIGLGTGSAFELSKRIKKNPANLKKWKNLKVLIIDEISMIDGKLFTKLDELAKIIRSSQLPFGGIQVICTGDFFQLPPVNKDGLSEFCFHSAAWDKVIQKTILLTRVFRQKGDTELIDMLNALRYGSMNDDMIAKFYKLSRNVVYDDGLEPTELFPTRDEVKRANQTRLSQIPSRPLRFKAEDNISDVNHIKMLDNLMCEKELELKEGAQVMYLKNLDDQIVNGSIGTVTCFMSSKLWEKVNDVYKGNLYDIDDQIADELRLLSSRVGCVANWSPEETEKYDRIPNERKSNFTKLAAVASSELVSDLYPVVNFKTATGNTLIRVTREDFSIEAGRIRNYTGGEADKITRSQLPLLLSWAISIHKAQGQTIDRLKIDLRKIFEKGQVYVALSRATNKDHLQILNFDPRRITASQDVKQFYHKLETTPNL